MLLNIILYTDNLLMNFEFDIEKPPFQTVEFSHLIRVCLGCERNGVQESDTSGQKFVHYSV